MDGGVFGNELRFSWSYSENLHDRATAAALAQGFVASLRALIAHCLSPDAGAGEHRPEDFPLARLDDRKLDQISALLDEIDGFAED